jgi:hypothetical protein
VGDRYVLHLGGFLRESIGLLRLHQRLVSGALVAVLFLGLSMTPLKSAQAFCTCNYPSCVDDIVAFVQTEVHITTEFDDHRQDFFVGELFEDNWRAAMQSQTAQLDAYTLMKLFTWGAFLDAKEQLERQRLFQQLTARAFKDYQPSHEMCSIGTLWNGLSAADRNTEMTAIILSKRSEDRHLGNRNSAGSGGQKLERSSRFEQFGRVYCNSHNNNNDGLDGVCPGSTGTERLNRDIDYTWMVEEERTKDDFNLPDTTGTNDDDEDFIALASNLYGHDIMETSRSAALAYDRNDQQYIYQRAAVAKRSVAENSFYNISAMRGFGSANADQAGAYSAQFLEQLGYTPDDAVKLLGEKPSYFARMEMLNKTIYQRPEFYTNLYTQPANIDRVGASIRAVNTIQEMDSFDSSLRSEAALAVLLELRIEALQRAAQNRQNESQGTDRK